VGDSKIATFKDLKKVAKGPAACDGTDCTGGCCIGQYNWFCCTDGPYCAATEDECPAPKMMKLASMKAKSKKVVKGAASCDGTDCPGGCCVGEYDWFCCTDGQYCAATEDDCPAPKMMKLASMKAKSKKVIKGAASCDGTDCPTGCCIGEHDWFCCADGQYCAATEDDCPAVNIINMARLKATSTKV